MWNLDLLTEKLRAAGARTHIETSGAHPLSTKAEKRNAILNRLCSEIPDHAVNQAAQPQGLFTLTVLTGSGKTFTSMAFALEHAKRHDMRRVIYVISFTGIIE